MSKASSLKRSSGSSAPLAPVWSCCIASLSRWLKDIPILSPLRPRYSHRQKPLLPPKQRTILLGLSWRWQIRWPTYNQSRAFAPLRHSVARGQKVDQGANVNFAYRVGNDANSCHIRTNICHSKLCHIWYGGGRMAVQIHFLPLFIFLSSSGTFGH